MGAGVDTPPEAHFGRLETGLAGRGSLRWVAVDIAGVLEEARLRLDLSPLAAVALGRSLTGAALLQRISFKRPARLVVEILGDGPLRKVVAEADEAGRLRGRVASPRVPSPADGNMRIAAAIGKGILRVTRETDGHSYSGQVALVSGELGDDFTHYLEQSEQIRSAVLLGVLPRPRGIAAAGGLVVEALPGTEEETIVRLEENIRRLDGVSARIDAAGLGGLAGAVLEELQPEPLTTHPLRYHCGCSRQSLRRQLVPLARTAPAAILDAGGECEAVCAFCGERYRFASAELTSPN